MPPEESAVTIEIPEVVVEAPDSSATAPAEPAPASQPPADIPPTTTPGGGAGGGGQGGDGEEGPEVFYKPTDLVEAPGGYDTKNGRYFDQITRPPYLNRAVVVINGTEYFEWESVAVTLERGGNPPAQCRLTVSEQEPWPEAFARIRIKPGESCDVFLDGYKAFAGTVVTRQVAYTATSHTVEIQAVSYAALLEQGTPATPTGEFKGQDLMSIAQSVAKPFGVKVTPVGNVPKDKFPRATVTPGESAWAFIEKLARQMGVHMATNPNGDLVLMVGTQGGSDDVVEGRNILEGREHISLWGPPKDIKAGGQAPGNDKEWGADPTHQRNKDGEQGNSDAGLQYMPQRTNTEMPAFSLGQVQHRLGMEQSFNDSVKIEATVTLLGWRRPSGNGIWVPGQQVYLDAPMLILHRSLTLKRVTFSQDNSSGTRSTLTLINMDSQKATE